MKWRIASTAMIGAFSVMVAATILTVALPAIMVEFAVPQAVAQWLITGFLAAMTTTMLLSAWCLARFGLRATFIGAILLFTAASLLGAAAPSIAWLILARVLQGAAAGVIQPLGMIVIFEAFPPAERGRGFGLYGLGVVFGPAIAPMIGGLLVDWVSWRAVFVIVLPLCLAVLPLARRYLRAGVAADPRPLDLPGLALIAATLAVGLWALARGPQLGWHDPVVAGALAAAVAGGVAFVLRELFCAAPLLDLRAFATGGFAGGFLATMAIGAGLFGSTYVIPLFLQQGRDMGASGAGLVLLPAGLGMALTFPIAGQLADKVRPVLVAGIGLVSFLVSCIALAAFDTGGVAWLTAWVLVGRVGLGLMMPPVTAASLRLLPPPLVPQGSGAINFGRQLGGALGVGLVAVVLQATADGYHAAFYALALVFAAGLVPLWQLHRTDG